MLLLQARQVRKAWRPPRAPVAQLPTSALGSEWRRSAVALAGRESNVELALRVCHALGAPIQQPSA